MPLTGYDATRFGVRLEGGSYGYFRGNISSGMVVGPWDYFASFSGRERDGYRDHSSENTEIFFGDLGRKFDQHWENRIYFTLDRTDRDLPGGLTRDELNNKPRKANPDSIAQDWNKSWNYARLADRLAFKSDEIDFTAGALWFHRDLAERGFFSPEFREGVEQYYSNNFWGNVQVIWRPDFYGHRSIIILGASPQFEYEHAQNYENLAGHAGTTTARGENNSINAPVYFEAQYYLTQRFSLLAGAQFVYAQRQFVDDFRQPSVGDQSQRQKFLDLIRSSALFMKSTLGRSFLRISAEAINRRRSITWHTFQKAPAPRWFILHSRRSVPGRRSWERAVSAA